MYSGGFLLAPRKREGLNTLYFSTNTSSQKVSNFINNENACVYFCNKRFFKGILLKGRVEVLTDEKHKKMIWQEGDTMYYSKGVNDPDYCVLKFTTKSIRVYENFSSYDIDNNK